MNIKCNSISRSNPLGSRSNTLVSCNNPLGSRSNPLGSRSNPLGSRSNLNALLRNLKLSALSCALVFATMNVGQAMEKQENSSERPKSNINIQKYYQLANNYSLDAKEILDEIYPPNQNLDSVNDLINRSISQAIRTMHETIFNGPYYSIEQVNAKEQTVLNLLRGALNKMQAVECDMIYKQQTNRIHNIIDLTRNVIVKFGQYRQQDNIIY